MSAVKSLSVWFLVMLLVTRSPIFAGEETLIELAKRVGPKPILIERTRELAPAQFEQLVSMSDLIVSGTVRLRDTYLSKDQRQLFTDYVVSPTRIILQKSVPKAITPGLPQPIVFTVWGGHTKLEGVDVTLRDRDAPSLSEDSQFILYLVNDGTGNGTFQLVNEVVGVLGMTNGRVKLLSKDNAYGPTFRQLDGQTVDQLDLEVRRLRQQ